MMLYGLNLPNGGLYQDARSLGEFARLAEGAGWDGIFLEDYIIWQGHQDVPTYDPWIALAAVALNTERIRLGTMVTALPRRRPWKLAKETVTLDHLSNGRLILGIGLGDTGESVLPDPSLTLFGEVLDIKRRAKMLDEALEVLVGLWSGQPFSFEGEHYRVKEVTCLPRPVQSPRIPIWIGGEYPHQGPMRRAARYDGACFYKGQEDMTPEDVQEIKAFIEKHRSTSAPYDFALGGRMRGDDWEAERALIRSLAAAGTTWWLEYLPPQVGGLEKIRARIERGPLRID